MGEEGDYKLYLSLQCHHQNDQQTINYPLLKGNRTEDPNWSETVEIFSSASFTWLLFYQYLYNWFFCLFASNLIPSVQVGSFFTKEVQKKAGSWRIWCFCTHSGHIYDVTNTDYWTQKGSTQGSCFRDFKTSNSNKQDEKSNRKLL